VLYSINPLEQFKHLRTDFRNDPHPHINFIIKGESERLFFIRKI
jgi:hypothetical protein